MQKLIFYGFSFLVCCFLLLFSTSLVYAQEGTLSLSPASGTFNKGCSFSIDIKLNTGGVSTDGTDVILFYDPTRFTANTVRSGTIYPDYPGNSIDPQNGKITVFGLSSAVTAFSGTGTLATIDLTVKSTAPSGPTQIKFDFDTANKAKTSDSNVIQKDTIVDILNMVTDGNYNIGTGVCGVATPSAQPMGGVGDVIPPVTQTVTQLPQSGNFGPTMIVAVLGGALIILGILGLIFL